MPEAPKWLRSLEQRFGWLAVSNLASFLVGLQVIGFVLVLSDPEWVWRLALLPDRVLQGEFWRVITFLAVPISLSPLWLVFILWFLYFVVDGIENIWGPFGITLYFLISVVLTVGFSLLFLVPITSVRDLHSTLFLAAAALNPQYQVLLFMVLPVKMGWLGWLTGAFVLWGFVTGSWLTRLYLVAIYANFLLFFGPYLYWRLKQVYRRWNFRRQLR